MNRDDLSWAEFAFRRKTGRGEAGGEGGGDPFWFFSTRRGSGKWKGKLIVTRYLISVNCILLRQPRYLYGNLRHRRAQERATSRVKRLHKTSRHFHRFVGPLWEERRNRNWKINDTARINEPIFIVRINVNQNNKLLSVLQYNILPVVFRTRGGLRQDCRGMISFTTRA